MTVAELTDVEAGRAGHAASNLTSVPPELADVHAKIRTLWNTTNHGSAHDWKLFTQIVDSLLERDNDGKVRHQRAV